MNYSIHRPSPGGEESGKNWLFFLRDTRRLELNRKKTRLLSPHPAGPFLALNTVQHGDTRLYKTAAPARSACQREDRTTRAIGHVRAKCVPLPPAGSRGTGTAPEPDDYEIGPDLRGRVRGIVNYYLLPPLSRP